MKVCLCGCSRAPVSLRGSSSFASHECRARYEVARARDREALREARGELETVDDGDAWSPVPVKADRPSEAAVRARLGLPEPRGGGL